MDAEVSGISQEDWELDHGQDGVHAGYSVPDSLPYGASRFEPEEALISYHASSEEFDEEPWGPEEGAGLQQQSQAAVQQQSTTWEEEVSPEASREADIAAAAPSYPAAAVISKGDEHEEPLISGPQQFHPGGHFDGDTTAPAAAVSGQQDSLLSSDELDAALEESDPVWSPRQESCQAQGAVAGEPAGAAEAPWQEDWHEAQPVPAAGGSGGDTEGFTEGYTEEYTEEGAEEQVEAEEEEVVEPWREVVVAGPSRSVGSDAFPSAQELVSPGLPQTSSGLEQQQSVLPRLASGVRQQEAEAGALAGDALRPSSSQGSARSRCRAEEAARPPGGGPILGRLTPGSEIFAAPPAAARPGSSVRQRQGSGSRRGRAAGSEGDNDVLLPEEWDVREVCEWLAAMGLEQYKSRFVHHVIDGRLLLRLGDAELKAELGIGPLGHRVTLLQRIEELQDLPSSQFASDLCHHFALARARGIRGAGGSRPLSRGAAGGRPGSRGRGAAGAGGGGIGSGGQAAQAKRPRSAPNLRARSPAVDEEGLLPGDAYLGPAVGKMTVQEQRAKLLFELSRAQARAARQATEAQHSSNVARGAQTEAERLAAALQDLDRKFKLQVEHAAGVLDSHARIPWQHVDPGTNAADPHPERHGRPWDGPTVDETFRPRISNKSREIMSSAGGVTFLDRLAADARRRAAATDEARRRHGFPSPAEPSSSAEAAKQVRADAEVIAGCCGTRWGMGLSSGGDIKTAVTAYARNPGSEAGAAAEALLNEVLELYGKELLLAEPRRAALLALRGKPKVAGIAAAIRSLEFLQRYEADLKTRDSRLAELQARWFATAAIGVAGGGGAAGGVGPGARGGGAVATGPAREAAAADEWFEHLGWQSVSEADEPQLLEALLARAAALKAEWDKARDRERDRPGAPRSTEPPPFDWSRAPWSVDGLGSLMEAELARQSEAAAAAAAETVASGGGRRASTSRGGGSAAAAAPAEAAGTSSGMSGKDWLAYSVKLLAGLTAESLAKLQAAPKKLAVYRALRSQRFLEFTEEDLRAREQKRFETWRKLTARHGKVVSKEEMDCFFERLQEDGRRRLVALDKARADRDAQQAKALAAAREAAASYKARRPNSALSAVPGAGRGGGSGRPASAPPRK